MSSDEVSHVDEFGVPRTKEDRGKSTMLHVTKDAWQCAVPFYLLKPSKDLDIKNVSILT